MDPEIPPVFARWEAFTDWMLDHTAKFPRSVRSSFTVRVENLTLEVFERLVEARYSRDRRTPLVRANMDIQKLRLFLRMAHRRRYLDTRSFEKAMEDLDDSGRQVGGWLRTSR